MNTAADHLRAAADALRLAQPDATKWDSPAARAFRQELDLIAQDIERAGQIIEDVEKAELIIRAIELAATL
jgi:hypothetical protein